VEPDTFRLFVTTNIQDSIHSEVIESVPWGVPILVGFYPSVSGNRKVGGRVLVFHYKVHVGFLWCRILEMLVSWHLFCTARLSPYIWKGVCRLGSMPCIWFVMMAKAVWPCISPRNDVNSEVLPSTAPPPVMVINGSSTWLMLVAVMIQVWLQLPSFTDASLVHITGV
jgi:hypothetical protein